jgi:hypothetical protein
LDGVYGFDHGTKNYLTFIQRGFGSSGKKGFFGNLFGK